MSQWQAVRWWVLAGVLVALMLGKAAASGEVTPLPKLVQNGVPEFQLGATAGETVLFRIVVPEGARDLKVNTSGGEGDVDIYIRPSAHPTQHNYLKAGLRGGNKERLRVAKPVAGVWYILLEGYETFRGVRLAVSYKGGMETRAVPRFFPGPGTYAGATQLTIETRLKRSVVRFTTDGTDPNTASEQYLVPLHFTTDTEVRAQTFLGTRPRGPVVTAPYFITPTGSVTALHNGVAVRHRAGLAGSQALYKITVPAGQQRLRLLTGQGSGEVSVYIRKDQPPTLTQTESVGEPVPTGNVIVNMPEPGEWFVLLHGKTDYFGRTVQMSYRNHQADLVVWPDRLEPYTSLETFTEDECEVQEGYITAGTHRLLRFSTETRNIGGGDLQVGAPEGNPNFEYQECHGHYHFRGFASYTLRRLDGEIAATGRKVSFCLIDVSQWDPEESTDPKYSCDEQGIQVGWSDVYDSGLPGQWIDITAVPPGAYTLEITINPEQVLEEADYTNNTIRIPVTID